MSRNLSNKTPEQLCCSVPDRILLVGRIDPTPQPGCATLFWGRGLWSLWSDCFVHPSGETSWYLFWHPPHWANHPFKESVAAWPWPVSGVVTRDIFASVLSVLEHCEWDLLLLDSMTATQTLRFAWEYGLIYDLNAKCVSAERCTSLVSEDWLLGISSKPLLT